MQTSKKETNLKNSALTKLSSEKIKTDNKKSVVSFKKDHSMIRIKLKSYDHKIIDKTSKEITETVLRYSSEVIGPIPLPTKIKKYTVNRSTFVHKKSRDQFEIRIHNRLIDVLNPNSKVIESLTHFSLPSSIDVKIKFL